MKARLLVGALAATSVFVGCPPLKTAEDLGVSSHDLIELKPHVTKVEGGRRLDVRVEAAKPGVARIFAVNSGGNLSPISPRVPVVMGKVIPLLMIETYEGDGVAPGGPAFVLAVDGDVRMDAVERMLRTSNPAELLRVYGDFVVTVERKR